VVGALDTRLRSDTWPFLHTRHTTQAAIMWYRESMVHALYMEVMYACMYMWIGCVALPVGEGA
jgi:hypothetical protein